MCGGGKSQACNEQKMQPTDQKEDSRKLIPPSCVFWYSFTFKPPVYVAPSAAGTGQGRSHHLPSLLLSLQFLPMAVPPARYQAGSAGAEPVWKNGQALLSSPARQNKQVSLEGGSSSGRRNVP